MKKQVSDCDVAVTKKRVIMRGHMARVFSILCIVALSIPAAWASETEGSSSEDWSFSATPYFWAAGCLYHGASGQMYAPTN